MSRLTAFGGARIVYGVACLLAPDRVLAVTQGAAPPGARQSGRPAPAWAGPTLRLLGARHLLQTAAVSRRPALGRLGTVVDLLHAATDVACAAAVPALRRTASADALVASALAAGDSAAAGSVEFGSSRRPRRNRTPNGRPRD